LGPCTYRHFNFPSQIENEKKNGKWTPNFIFHFSSQMENENGYPFSIFHFLFAMENAKWATEKATKTTTHILIRSHNYC